MDNYLQTPPPGEQNTSGHLEPAALPPVSQEIPALPEAPTVSEPLAPAPVTVAPEGVTEPQVIVPEPVAPAEIGVPAPLEAPPLPTPATLVPPVSPPAVAPQETPQVVHADLMDTDEKPTEPITDWKGLTEAPPDAIEALLSPEKT